MCRRSKCKAVAGMPLNTHHRCAVCNYCLHGDCGIELKETEKNKAPFSHKAICFVCIDRIQAGRLIKLDKTQGTQFISLRQHKVFKLVQSIYKPVKLIDPVPFDDNNDDIDYSSDNPDIFIAGKNPEYNVTAKDITRNIKATNTTKNTNNTTTAQPEPQKNPPKTSPLKETTAIDEDSDEDTVDVGNSRATPHSSTPKNAATIIFTKFINVQIKLDPIKTTKPIGAINACINRCKIWLSEIQEIEPSFKLHPVDPPEQNQTILHAVSDFPKNLTDLKVSFKNARSIMKGGQLYRKT
jgi:hypothetical protein